MRLSLVKGWAIVLIVAFLSFITLEHGRLWNGIFGDLATQEQRNNAAESFDFENYYTYGAAFSDLDKILAGREVSKSLIDKILTRQKAFISIRESTPYKPDKERPETHLYIYDFHRLYAVKGMCNRGDRDGFQIRYDKEERLLSFIYRSECYNHLFSQKKADLK